jgi:voltage-gated potassium channel
VLRSRLKLPIAMLVITNVVGTFGYHVLWESQGGTWLDGLFMTFTTISTIGFGEVKHLDSAGRVFTMLIATAGIGSLFYTFSVGLDHLTSDAVRLARRRRKMEQAIRKLQRHFVLAGFGRVGREAARELRGAGVEVVVVESEPDMVRSAAEAGLLVVHGDATEDATLEAAGVKAARGLVVTTPSDATNLSIILSARLLSPALFIVSRAVSETSVAKLMRAGANRAISPHAIGGKRLAHLSLNSRLVDLFESAFQRGRHPLRIVDLEVPGGVAGHSVKWLVEGAAEGATVLAMLRGEQPLPSPPPGQILEAGDHVLLLGTEAQMDAVERLLAEEPRSRN